MAKEEIKLKKKNFHLKHFRMLLLEQWRLMQAGEDIFVSTLQWRHNGRDGVSNHQPHHCLLNRLFRRRSRKHRSSASVAFVFGIYRWPGNSPHKWPVTRKLFSLDDVIMQPDTFVSGHAHGCWTKHLCVELGHKRTKYVSLMFWNDSRTNDHRRCPIWNQMDM